MGTRYKTKLIFAGKENIKPFCGQLKKGPIPIYGIFWNQTRGREEELIGNVIDVHFTGTTNVAILDIISRRSDRYRHCNYRVDYDRRNDVFRVMLHSATRSYRKARLARLQERFTYEGGQVLDKGEKHYFANVNLPSEIGVMLIENMQRRKEIKKQIQNASKG